MAANTPTVHELPPSSDIVIVGAGPAGLATALVLASKKIPFVIVDALKEGQNESRAAVVHSYTLEQLEPVGVTDTLVAHGIPMSVFEPNSDAETPVTRIDIGRALKKHTKYPYALLIAQCDIEAILTARLKELGGIIHREKRVARMEELPLDEDGAGFKLQVFLESGESVKAKYVVAGDGSKSVIRSSAGIAFVDPHSGKPSVATDADQQLVLADVLLHTPLPPTLPMDRIWPLFDAHGFLLLIPLKSSTIQPQPGTHLFRFAATVRQGTAPHAPDAEYVQRILDERGPGHAKGGERPRVAHVASGSRYRVRSGLSETFAKKMPGGGWVLLAGDAGHIHSPAGGQGMNLGLCDGLRVAHAFVAVTSGTEPADDAFKKYNDMRRPAARTVINMVEVLTAFNGHWLADNVLVKTLRNWVAWFALTCVPGMQEAVAWRMSGLVHRET